MLVSILSANEEFCSAKRDGSHVLLELYSPSIIAVRRNPSQPIAVASRTKSQFKRVRSKNCFMEHFMQRGYKFVDNR